ncbi:hypothetical protein F5Y12DRAFT_511791 [Xylaria sp. FL1777]|nr:hypothetical protein F5Y12DRAFT_511791 [Xylaria sp. FL1777]
MASKNCIGDTIPQVSELFQQLQRQHSSAQSKFDILASEEEDRGGSQISVSTPIYMDNALTESRDLSKPTSVDDCAHKSRLRNHTEASSAAAQWVACQADFVNTHEEAVSPPQSHPTRSTQSPANSIASVGTTQGSHLPALQNLNLADHDGLKPLATEEFDPVSFDLVAPPETPQPQYSIEVKSELLLSVDHLRIIFNDPNHMQKFTDFLYALKPESVPLLNYYLNLVKALRAIGYANALMRELDTTKRAVSVKLPPTETINKSLIDRADEAFGLLAQEELPAYVAHVWNRIVNMTIKRRINDTLSPMLRDLSEGLADVFCLTDPSRDDNPILFASEEFHRTTQYGRRFALGRNCRFLQGPKTNQHSVRRLREMLVVGKEYCEPLLNYRRDGSAFMNLLMITPLYDSRGNIRYHLGAQVDVSGLLKECAGLSSLAELVAQKELKSGGTLNTDRDKGTDDSPTCKDILDELAEIFSLSDLKIAQASGEMVHERHNSTGCSSLSTNNRSQSLIKDGATPIEETPMDNSISSSALTPLTSSSLTDRVRGIIDHFLLVRPFPNLRILFVSPSLRVPGILQSPFMSRIGGSQSARDRIAQAFKDGAGITTKVRWLARPMTMTTSGRSTNLSNSGSLTNGRSRWMHATPLLGVNGAVGVWVIILVDDEEKHRVPSAPPVDLFNMERRRPFDVDIDADDLDKSMSEAEAEAESVSVEHGEVEVLDPGPVHTRRPPSHNGREWTQV